jgi:hypothetical protein
MGITRRVGLQSAAGTVEGSAEGKVVDRGLGSTNAETLVRGNQECTKWSASAGKVPVRARNGVGWATLL